MLEKYLIEHCSPTLASLKTANLFTYTFSSESSLRAYTDEWNRRMEEKGIRLWVLRIRDHSALIYVCRMSHLKRDLENPGVRFFLKKCGYESAEPEYALEHLKERLKKEGDFPHEIGVFLGYPLGDVIGFIQNAGMNSKCSGCWKVYCNECDTVRLFAKYKKCREVYVRLWNQGRSIWRLTVAA
ncbi:MAG: DUF3793 family protein [Eubacteriales bacterium]|nr:DUF3793 family protein [Eubacteriales bacterium]